MLHAPSLHTPLSTVESFTVNLIDQTAMPEITDSELPWLRGKLQTFQDMTDAVVVLDDGCELPVHSAVLSMQSPVLCEAFAANKEGLGTAALKTESCRVHLQECSLKEACSFISFFYMAHQWSVEEARSFCCPGNRCCCFTDMLAYSTAALHDPSHAELHAGRVCPAAGTQIRGAPCS